MHRDCSSLRPYALPTWQVCVCLLLAALILYNPFLAADSVAGLSVRHSASNRATVGASELQHFSPAQKSSELLPGDALLLFALFIPHLTYATCQQTPAVLAPRRTAQHLASSLWFRPPPSL